eukprot:COSAG06_NODE_13901_length_1211_cov_1.268953_2_plen_92_part_00
MLMMKLQNTAGFIYNYKLHLLLMKLLLTTSTYLATTAITIVASAAAGAVVSRRDLVETFGSSGFTVSPSVAAQSYQATGSQLPQVKKLANR